MKNANKTLLNITLVGAALTALTACSTPSASTGPTVFNNPVQVAESIERLELYTRPNGLELSALPISLTIVLGVFILQILPQ